MTRGTAVAESPPDRHSQGCNESRRRVAKAEGGSDAHEHVPAFASAARSALATAGALLALLLGADGAIRAAQLNFDDVEIHVLPVQGNVYMLVGAGGNVTVQVGEQGVVVVDTQFAPLVPKLMAAIRTLSDRPIHTIINTHVHGDHTGGNGELQKFGAGGRPARLVSHENVLRRMMASPDYVPNSQAGLPLSTYFTPTRDIHVNGEAIVLHHAPAAHTDGDSLVFFRGSDVLSVGDVFSPDAYPVIDLENGGSLQGLIDAANQILAITVPAQFQQGGTYVIPGHGRLCDEAEVVEYRDMLVIIRDRMQALIDQGMTLEQVQAARPSRDYDTEYGSDTGFWTTEMFVEAAYRSLTE